MSQPTIPKSLATMKGLTQWVKLLRPTIQDHFSSSLALLKDRKVLRAEDIKQHLIRESRPSWLCCQARPNVPASADKMWHPVYKQANLQTLYPIPSAIKKIVETRLIQVNT